MHKIDIDNWDRKENYLFFKQFDEPFHGVCVEVDVTHTYQKAKELGYSFFAYYLHQFLHAVNEIEAFRYRIVNDEVFLYDRVDVSATIGRSNGTFGFSYVLYSVAFTPFVNALNAEKDRIEHSSALFPSQEGAPNVIHFSALPWLFFTSLSHARTWGREDSCPKISVGKMIDREGRKIMPVSIHVHHALVDGRHVGEFVAALQRILHQPY